MAKSISTDLSAWLTVADIATRIGCTQDWAQKLARRGEFAQDHRTGLYSAASVVAFLSRRRGPGNPLFGKSQKRKYVKNA